LILGLIVAVASLNIAGTLILVVLSKGREIAIMKAMGATSQQIRGIFIFEGLFIGLVGGSVGTVLGLLGCIGLDRYGWPLDTDVYYLDRLPVEIEPTMVALVGVVAVLICFLATLYPASRAAAIDPAEGLRYE
ncbi:FtsX-like permease family protein, partial [Myxococcota bacterium]|nr:FtsX-like permease family protein [Myxococcota bacterium]